jgi:hypothetical protein
MLVVYNGIKRQTIEHGRNNGARVPQGEFLVLIDANCFIRDPDSFFRTAISNFDRVCNLVALTGPSRVLLESRTVSDKFMIRIFNSLVLIKNNAFHEGEVPGGEFQMIPRQTFAKARGYDEELVTQEEEDIFSRLSRLGRTLCDLRLTIFKTGRLAHQYGWSHIIGRLLYTHFRFTSAGEFVPKNGSFMECEENSNLPADSRRKLRKQLEQIQYCRVAWGRLRARFCLHGANFSRPLPDLTFYGQGRRVFDKLAPFWGLRQSSRGQ